MYESCEAFESTLCVVHMLGSSLVRAPVPLLCGRFVRVSIPFVRVPIPFVRGRLIRVPIPVICGRVMRVPIPVMFGRLIRVPIPVLRGRLIRVPIPFVDLLVVLLVRVLCGLHSAVLVRTYCLAVIGLGVMKGQPSSATSCEAGSGSVGGCGGCNEHKDTYVRTHFGQQSCRNKL